MAKISKEEYEILKGLENQWKWIARDSDGDHGGGLFVYSGKPYKDYYTKDWRGSFLEWLSTVENHLFQFIQWEDSEPYNIQELIEEYESEETEVKKNIEWLKEEVNEIKKLISDAWGAAIIAGNRHFEIKNSSEMQIVKRISGLIDQLDEPEVTLDKAFEKVAESYSMTKEEIWRHLERLVAYGGKVTYGELDEPEVLSQEWISEHSNGPSRSQYVWVNDLKELLVPKQEDADQAYKDGYEKGKQHTFYKGYLEGITDKGSEPETIADVVTTFWKSYERLKEVMSMEVEEWEND